MARRFWRPSKKQIEKFATLYDGCNPEMVQGARFDGALQIPIIEKPDKVLIPKGVVPFSKMDRVLPEKFAVCEYEPDVEFGGLLRDPEKYVEQLRAYQAWITPDCSMYWDAPLAAIITNKYRNHVIGYYMQQRGIYTIPNVRWGDERTYTTQTLPEPLAFLGVERHSVVSIGSYGAVKTKDEKRHFRAGLEAMLDWLEPEAVLVYGSMPEDVFGASLDRTEFVRYPDWTTYIKEITPDKPKEQ